MPEECNKIRYTLYIYTVGVDMEHKPAASRKLSITKFGLGIVVLLGMLSSLPFVELSEQSLRTLVMGVTTLVLGYCGGNVGEWYARRKS